MFFPDENVLCIDQAGADFTSVPRRERERASRFQFVARKNSYLLGRLAVFELLRRIYDGQSLEEVEIINSSLAHEHGQPRIKTNGQTKGHISITHSEQMAACAFNFYHPIGIDLEKVAHRDESFTSQVFLPEEIQYIQSFHQSRQREIITLFWTAKEAMAKCLGLGLSISTKSISVQLDGEKLNFSDDTTLQPIRISGSVRQTQRTFRFKLKARRILNAKGDVFFLTVASECH